MKILIDRYIPFLDGVLEPYGTVEYIAPEDFTPARVHDADALIVRTRTRIDEHLLAGSQVRFVTTATIGYDHIDTDYCQRKGIVWTSCPGCNAQAVCDYIEEVLTDAPIHRLTDIPLTLGIVGVGHVGSKVAKMAERMGWRVLLNDPPKGIGVSLDKIAAQADAITFHTPLDKNTYYLCDAAFLSKCQPHALIINAARGGIVDETALLKSGHPYVLDCWENEPDICSEVVQNERCLLASYHIAGYSQEGKRNASQMCLDALCRFFQLTDSPIHLSCSVINSDSPTHRLTDSPKHGWLARITEELKSSPSSFEALRKAYPLR